MKRYSRFEGSRNVSRLDLTEAAAEMANRHTGKKIYLLTHDDYAMAINNRCQIYREEITTSGVGGIIRDYITVPMSELVKFAEKINESSFE